MHWSCYELHGMVNVDGIAIESDGLSRCPCQFKEERYFNDTYCSM